MITVYTKPGCSACDATKIWLRRYRVAYVEHDVDADACARAAVDALGYTSMPVVAAGDEHWSGFRIGRLKGLLT